MIRIATLTATVALLAATTTMPRATAQSLGLDEAAAKAAVERMLPTLRARAGIVLYPPIDVRFVTRDALREALAVEWTAALSALRGDDGALAFDESRAATTASAIAAALAPRFAVRHVGGDDGALLLVPENAALVRGTTSRDTRRHVEAAIARELARSAPVRGTTVPAPVGLSAFIARCALEEAVASWAGTRVTRQRAEPKRATHATADTAGRIVDAIVGKARATALAYVDRIARKDASRTQLLELRPASVAAFDGAPSAPATVSPIVPALASLSALTGDDGWHNEDRPQPAATVAKALEPALGASTARRLTRGLVQGTRRTATHPARGNAHFTILEMNNASSAYAWVVAQRKVVAKRDDRLDDDDVTIERSPTRTIRHDAFPVLEETRTTIRAAEQQTTAIRLTGVCRHFCFELVTTESMPVDRRRAFLDALAESLTPKGLPRH